MATHLLVNIIKFIHLLFALGLLSLVIRSTVLVGPQQYETRRDKVMLGMALFALLTGTLLVYPKHFTFHTPWIQAAFLLVVLFSLGIFSQILVKKKRLRPYWIINGIYFVLVILLLFVVHDAVTKSTFLF